MRILFLIALLCYSLPGAAQWHKVNSGTVADIVDMVFIDSITGYAIGEKGTIIKTIDRGENWSFFHQDTVLYQPYQLSIVATDDSVFCFGQSFSGDYYKISFRQGDNIFSAQQINFIPYDPVFWNNKLYFIDGGLLCTYDNNVIDTILLDTEYFTIIGNYISSSNPTNIYFSDDYGQTWMTKKFTNSLLSSGPYQSFYNGSDTLLATTNYPAIFHKSYDKGQNWIPHNGYYYIRCYFTKNAIYGLTLLPTLKNIVFSSVDFGQTFQTDTLADPVSRLYFFNSSIGFAFGENGIIYKTTNGGGITGIKETGALKKRILIYPNPAKNSITLKIEENIIIQSVRLIDINGRLIKEQKGNLRSFSTENIPAGNYLLEVQTNKGVFTKKVIIQK